MKTYKVLICDDHPVVRAGLRLILQKEKDFQIVGDAENVEQAIDLASRKQPDLVLMDISLPGLNGLEAIPHLRTVAPEAKVIILTIHDDEAYLIQALRANVAGYVLKGASTDELLAALRLVNQGGVPIPRALNPKLFTDYLERAQKDAVSGYNTLSSREREILKLVYKGRTNKQIAEELFLSVRTVERHRSTIMRKAGLENRAELVAYAVRRGFLTASDSSSA
jgi:two-component system response regulator NreC